jgi:holo-[acyl-carrier protein] synthase
MIVGIGTDLVDISRIEKSIARNPQALARRVLTVAELDKYLSHSKSADYLAKRFAAKEAAAKALGTGIGKISWQDLEVTNDDSGAPRLTFSGNAKQLMTALGGDSIQLSLADDGGFALAFVVISAR